MHYSARCFSFRMYILHNSSARQLLSSFYRYQHLGLVRYNNFPFCTINDSAIYFICVDIDLAWVEATDIQMEFSVIFISVNQLNLIQPAMFQLQSVKDRASGRRIERRRCKTLYIRQNETWFPLSRIHKREDSCIQPTVTRLTDKCFDTEMLKTECAFKLLVKLQILSQ